MFNIFNNSNNQNNFENNYISDYPQVFFTNSVQPNNQNYQSYQNNYQQPTNQSFLSNLLNSDLVKQIVPLLLGGKNNANIFSTLKNSNLNIGELINSLSTLNSKQENTKNLNSEKSKHNNIIDMSDFEEIK